MGPGRAELVYVNLENWRAEEARRENPRQVMATKVGSKRRITVVREALIEDGPAWMDGSRTSWYVTCGDLGEVKIVPVRSATELVNLPTGALPLQEFANLAANESPGLAAELFGFLGQDAGPHTAHHTIGADIGPRLRAIFQLAQLDSLTYQDPEIGRGITIPAPVHRPRDPATVVGPDGVTW